VTRDDNVVAAAKRGESDAWRELYRAHAGRLLVWLEHRSPLDSATQAEDLAAETWLTAARKVRDFHGDADEFAGWLFGIARKLAANARRSGARRRTSPTDHVPDIGIVVPGPDHTVPADDWVRHALGLLSPTERDVIACTEVVGLDNAGAARALGISQVSVRVTRHRALKRLRQLLDSGELVASPSP